MFNHKPKDKDLDVNSSESAILKTHKNPHRLYPSPDSSGAQQSE
jgi:hypothetical protein